MFKKVAKVFISLLIVVASVSAIAVPAYIFTGEFFIALLAFVFLFFLGVATLTVFFTLFHEGE